jgi:erythromycin esterase-like protein
MRCSARSSPRTPCAWRRIDPDAGLDDLYGLVESLGRARVVAIGESAHCVREYYLLRHRLTRLLVERCGFTVFGMESGFSEGLDVDAWVLGAVLYGYDMVVNLPEISTTEQVTG